jgi:hypothetical protein
MRLLIVLICALAALSNAEAQNVRGLTSGVLAGSGQPTPDEMTERNNHGYYVNQSNVNFDDEDMGDYCDTTYMSTDVVRGVMRRIYWPVVEPTDDDFNFNGVDSMLTEAESRGDCQVFFFFRTKGFGDVGDDVCPVWLVFMGQPYCAANAQDGDTVMTYEIDGTDNTVADEVVELLNALAAHVYVNGSSAYNGMTIAEHPLVEGIAFQETALGLNGSFIQDEGSACTGSYPRCEYTPEGFYTYTETVILGCGNASPSWNCVQFFNNWPGTGNRTYFEGISDVLESLSNERGVYAGPDALPDTATSSELGIAYDVMVERHSSKRGWSIQHVSHSPGGNYTMGGVLDWMSAGSFGAGYGNTGSGTDCRTDQNDISPVIPTCGLCVDAYKWINPTSSGQTYTFATHTVPAMFARPYGATHWWGKCANGGVPRGQE